MTDLETTLRSSLTDAADAVTVSPEAWEDYRRAHPAAPGRRPVRPRLRIAASVAGIAAATAGIVVGSLALTSGSRSHVQPAPALNRTASISVALTPNRTLTAAALRRSARILQSRLVGAGATTATVAVSGNTLSARIPRTDAATLRALAATRGRLAIRLVLGLDSGASFGSGVRHGPELTWHSPRLDAALLTGFHDWDCVDKTAGARNPTAGRFVGQYVIACSADGSQKFLLAPAAVRGRDITSAEDGLDATGNANWIVNLSFDHAGATAFHHLTARAYQVNHGQAQTGSCGPPTGCNAIAIVKDGIVQSDPYISSAGGIPGGRVEISGVTHAQAVQLAAVLRDGPLPTTFAAIAP